MDIEMEENSLSLVQLLNGLKVRCLSVWLPTVVD